MKPEEFCYWLQGFFELSEATTLSGKQIEMIKNHLNLVFFHSIDPKATEGMTKEEAAKKQEKLYNIHDPTGKDPLGHLLRC